MLDGVNCRHRDRGLKRATLAGKKLELAAKHWLVYMDKTPP